jgi:hypothetical protein
LREALAELETSLYIMGKDTKEGSSEWLVEHAERLAASGISWALDLLAMGPKGPPLHEAFESLCLAECLTRAAICGESPNRLFLRSLCLSGLGTYYWLRKKAPGSIEVSRAGIIKGSWPLGASRDSLEHSLSPQHHERPQPCPGDAQ